MSKDESPEQQLLIDRARLWSEIRKWLSEMEAEVDCFILQKYPQPPTEEETRKTLCNFAVMSLRTDLFALSRGIRSLEKAATSPALLYLKGQQDGVSAQVFFWPGFSRFFFRERPKQLATSLNSGSGLFRIVYEMEHATTIGAEIIFSGIESALHLAAQKKYGEGTLVTVAIDRDTGKIVAKKAEELIDPAELRLIAIQSAKNVVIQQIREKLVLWFPAEPFEPSLSAIQSKIEGFLEENAGILSPNKQDSYQTQKTEAKRLDAKPAVWALARAFVGFRRSLDRWRWNECLMYLSDIKALVRCLPAPRSSALL